MNGGGTKTKIASHRESDNAPVFEDISDFSGEHREIDLLKMAKAVQAISKKLSAQGDTSFNEFTNILKVTTIPVKDFKAVVEQKTRNKTTLTEPAIVRLNPLTGSLSPNATTKPATSKITEYQSLMQKKN